MRIPVPLSRLRLPPLSPLGLSAAAVAEQRAQYGTNVIVEGHLRSLSQRIRETAADPMLWFLLVTSAIYLLLGEVVEGVILLVAVLPLTGMDAFLHHRTQASTEGLEIRLAAQATALREGREERVAASDVVVGDLLMIRAGELVPADGLLSAVEALQIEESSLTGEAYPIRKRPLTDLAADGDGAPLVEDVHWAFAGTRVLAGSGALRVVNTGADTLYGQIVRAATLSNRVRTPLQAAIGQLVVVLSAAAVALCLLLAFVRWHQGRGWVDALVSATTLAVAALPEEFPVAFTFFLGAGVYRLARRQALVRQAVSVENIGRITTICADKTGTLTKGTLSVTELEPSDLHTAEELLFAATRASREEGADPLDAAILAEAKRFPLPELAGRRLALFPFTEDRRRETAIWLEAGSLIAATKGAPELVLSLCELDSESHGRWLERVNVLAAQGRKAIACATQRVSNDSWRGVEPTSRFNFLGLIVCEDPVRDGVTEAIRSCREAGLHALMVTGDHPATASAVARAIGLGGSRARVLLGEELEATVQRGTSLREFDIIARALPVQKLALVRALQAQGEHVLVTGDGVNDVPALQAADVGVAMGERGTRSAREVASIVLLDDNFRTIVRAVAEGRQLFSNLRASFEYLLIIHIPLVFTAAFVPLAGYPLLYLPIHIVWLELIIHPTALLAFQAAAGSDRLHPMPRTRGARFFSWRDWLVLLSAGSIGTAVVSAGFLHSLAEASNVPHGRAMALAVLTLVSVLSAALLSRLQTRAAIIVTTLTLAMTIALIQVEPLSVLLHLEPLHWDDWMLAIAGGLLACAPIFVERALAVRRGGQPSDGGYHQQCGHSEPRPGTLGQRAGSTEPSCSLASPAQIGVEASRQTHHLR
jgi:P-type Ca2+ transporter type 2C